mmetsp:Transcript_88711/g.286649  ORF Transcript_88711/g.286649 Transcript_88711/m.286649 type:complete len:195 (-) Transcript_88711:272-856(-)
MWRVSLALAAAALLVAPVTALGDVGTEEEAFAADDECLSSSPDGSCSLSALQLRAHGRSAQEEGSVEGVATSVRRRRGHQYVYPTTNVTITTGQPDTCKGKPLKKGYESCCSGTPFELKSSACCGTIPFYTAQLGCCNHGDGTATLYDPLSQNCCDDEFAENKEEGICDVPHGETSCCQLTGRRRRQRRRRTGA